MPKIVILAALASLFCGVAKAAAPQLYVQSAYESPVRGDPDDLLLLAGYGFAAGDQVVYQAADGMMPLHPAKMPTHSTAQLGLAAVVSATLPYSLTVKLPQCLRIDQTYVLWVRTARGEWSKPVRINDARPLWFSPASAHSTESVASLPRELKVIGRNLQPSPGASTRIQLIGPQRYQGEALREERLSATMDHYVARLRLPPSITPGDYHVQVNRGGSNWVEVPGQVLHISEDLAAGAEYVVSDPRFGGCRPDDGADDTPCIVRALAEAKRAGTGTVYFGPGTWDIIDSSRSGVIPYDGIVVPVGVQLRGAGSTATRILRHREWNAGTLPAAFTLIGHNGVSGFKFSDQQVFRPQERAGPFFQIGEDFQRIAADRNLPSSAAVASHIVIEHNEFDKTYIAIRDGGLPINQLFITYNIFGAYLSALELGGNRFNMTYPYRIDDSVIDYNVFKPSSRLDVVEKSGSIASELGAGFRVDFSHNTADGSSTDYFYSPDDPRGWASAFFWNLDGNVEETLVSENIATCTADKIGDGPAIAYDNNGNTFALPNLAEVSRATPTTLAVATPLITRQNDRDVPVSTYYLGHWLQVVSGPGLGQVRKISAYTTDPATGATTFSLSTAWDVVPVPGRTRVAVGREFWQVYTLHNQIDHRQPLCQKSNRSRHDGGAIALFAQSADSVVEGNQQFDTDGILLQEVFIVPEHACATCSMSSFFQSFVEVRANQIEGEYDWSIDCSASGIVAGAAAAPWNDADPPTVGYAVTVAHNKVNHADAPLGGAIAQVNSWHAGPEPHRWPLSSNMLIHHNMITDLEGDPALPVCGKSHPRIGINFPEPQIAWHTVLYANSCDGVAVPIGNRGVDTVRVCPSRDTRSCECP